MAIEVKRTIVGWKGRTGEGKIKCAKKKKKIKCHDTNYLCPDI